MVLGLAVGAPSKCSHRGGSGLGSSPKQHKQSKKMSSPAAKSGGLAAGCGAAASVIAGAFGGCPSKSPCPVPEVVGSQGWAFRKYSLLFVSAQNHAQRLHLEEKREAPSAPTSCKATRSHGAARPCARRGSRSPWEQGTPTPAPEQDFAATTDPSLSSHLPGVRQEPSSQRSAPATPLPRSPHPPRVRARSKMSCESSAESG